MIAAAGQVSERYLDGDRGDVESLQSVHALHDGQLDQVIVVERPQASEVEDAAEVDEERIRPLPDEDPPAAGETVDRLGGKCV